MGETFFDRKKKEDNEKTRATLDQLATCFEYQGKISKEKRNTISEVLGMTEITVPTHILVRKLGSGGSGDVYLAMKDHSKVPRKIKIFRRDELHPHIKAQRSRRDLIDIVQQESDVLAEISHPNVTRYFDHGVASDRRPYTVSEYVEGTTVEEALPTLSFAERAAIFYQLAKVMVFFHRQGYVIRDFKLNNAIWNPEKKVVKVTDLETIRRIEDEREEGNSTRGSDRYAAPELLRGERATTKSDLYALGACFFYLAQGSVGGLEQITSLPEDEYNKAMHERVEQVKVQLHEVWTEGHESTRPRVCIDKLTIQLQQIWIEGQRLTRVSSYGDEVLTMLLAYRPDARNNAGTNLYDQSIRFDDLLFSAVEPIL